MHTRHLGGLPKIVRLCIPKEPPLGCCAAGATLPTLAPMPSGLHLGKLPEERPRCRKRQRRVDMNRSERTTSSARNVQRQSRRATPGMDLPPDIRDAAEQREAHRNNHPCSARARNLSKPRSACARSEAVQDPLPAAPPPLVSWTVTMSLESSDS